MQPVKVLDEPSARPSVTSVIGSKAIIAVVEIADVEVAPELARVLGDAGIDALEITLRTPGAISAIERAAAVDSLSVGAGTVMSPSAAIDSVESGACFLASPVFDAAVAESCRSLNIALMPGVVTPSEVKRAHDEGFREVKLFPAGNFGGISLVKSLRAVFPDVFFIPTGGVTPETAIEYLAHEAVAAIGGTWIAPAALISEHKWSEITKRAEHIVAAIRSMES